jgi:HEAT repeat protein/beta-lactamase regulating signal transducer with metallopeptidase domain
MTAMLLMQIAAKATLVLLAGWGMTGVMARASAASRHLVWVLTLAAALAVPVLHLAGPVWTLSVLPQRSPRASEPAPMASTEVVHGALASEVTGVAEASPAVASPDVPAPPSATARFASDAATYVGSMPAVDSSQAARVSSLSLGTLVVGVWIAGMAVMLLRLAIGVIWAGLTVRRAHALPHTGWLDSLDDAAGAMGLTRKIGLKVSARAAVPMATGLWRPTVLLPLSAIDWPEERRRVVLQHELAHIKRRDCLLQALAQCVSAVHWFNPAAHMAVSRLRAEQERACDDMVIQVGTDARSYADHLFEIARSFRAASFPTWVSMSMARPSQLEGRMLAILDRARVRCAPSLGFRTALTVGACALALPLGALRLGAQTPVQQDRAVETATSSPATSAGMDARSSSGAAIDAGPSVDIVRGDLVDLAMLVPSPMEVRSLADHHERLAAEEVLRGAIDRQVIEAAVFRNAIPGMSLLLAQASPAPGAATVTDETRKRVADALITALNDDNVQVRQEALSALASMRDDRAIPGLVRALSDPMTEVRMRALGSLVQFNSAAAADGVLSALKDRDAEVREQAARHLASLVSRGQLRDAKYVDAFSSLLRDENAGVREQAVAALGRLRVPGAAAPLMQALKDSSPDVREQAARALGQLGSTDAVPSLTALLKDPDTDVREQAALALGNLADPRAIDALTAALKDTEPSVREQVARALGQIARGQRRGVRPGVPVPPVPPLPPRAIALDVDQIRDMAERARIDAERMQRDAERARRDAERQFRRFELPFNGFPLAPPEPAPAPAPVPPR